MALYPSKSNSFPEKLSLNLTSPRADGKADGSGSILQSTSTKSQSLCHCRLATMAMHHGYWGMSISQLLTPKHQHIRFKTSSEHSKLALHPSPAIASHIDHCSLVRLDIKNGKPLEPRAGSRTHLSSVWFASAAPETWQVAVWKRDFATMRAWFLMVFHISSLKDPKVRYCNLACSNCSSAPKSVTACSCHVTMCDWLPLWWSLMFCVSSIRGDFARFCKCI